MAFVDRRLLNSNERCQNWVAIGDTVYMSVVNTVSGYFRIYKSVGGGPVQEIRNATTNQLAYFLFKVGGTLYAGYRVNNVNSFQIDKYLGGTSWQTVAFLNGGSSVICYREYDGKAYLLLTGYSGFVQDGKTWLTEFDGSTLTVLRESGDGSVESRVMRSFDIHPDTGLFYIADTANGIGAGSMAIFSKSGATEETLISWGAGVEPLDVSFIDGTLYVTRTSSSGGQYHVFSSLSDLTTSAVENIISDNTIENGAIGLGAFRPVRSALLHDLLVVQYYKVNGEIGFFSYDSTEDVLTVLDDYPNGTALQSQFGFLTVDGDNVIAGVMGKFINLYHQAPDDEDPPAPPPTPSEDLTEELLIEVRTAPCNPVTLCWLNSLGAYETYCFEDLNGTFEHEIKTKIDAEFERYVEDLETDTNSTGITRKTVERTMRLGADSIDADIFVGLLDLVTSPAVFMMTERDPLTWLSVKVSPGTFRYSEYDRALEFTIELPNMFVQRA